MGPWLDPAFLALAAVITLMALLFGRATMLSVLIHNRVYLQRPNDPKLDFFSARNHWSYVLQLDRELFPNAPEERQRRELHFETIAFIPLFLVFGVLLRIYASRP